MLDCRILDEVHRFSLFHGLPPDQLVLFSQSLHQKRVAANQELLSVGYKSEIVYFLLEGTTRISIPQSGGGGTILNICGPGAVLGEISAIDGAGHSANVTTIGECRFLWMGSAKFKEHLYAMPMLGVNLSCLLAQRLRHASRHAHHMARLSVPMRLAYLLLDIARHYPTLISPSTGNEAIPLPLALPQADLAATVAATRVSVHNTLSEFQQKQWIQANRQHITICHRAALEEFCNGQGTAL